MEVITATDPALQLTAENPTLSPEDIRKILNSRMKRVRKKEALRSRQRNAKSGVINKFKLDIINDMFEKEPQGYAHTDSNGRNYYTCNGTTVRL